MDALLILDCTSGGGKVSTRSGGVRCGATGPAKRMRRRRIEACFSPEIDGRADIRGATHHWHQAVTTSRRSEKQLQGLLLSSMARRQGRVGSNETTRPCSAAAQGVNRSRPKIASPGITRRLPRAHSSRLPRAHSSRLPRAHPSRCRPPCPIHLQPASRHRLRPPPWVSCSARPCGHLQGHRSARSPQFETEEAYPTFSAVAASDPGIVARLRAFARHMAHCEIVKRAQTRIKQQGSTVTYPHRSCGKSWWPDCGVHRSPLTCGPPCC